MSVNPRSVDEALESIKAVSEKIEWNPVANSLGSPSRYWQGMGLDALILSSPQHDGGALDIARNTYHRLSARFIGAQAHKLQRSFMIKALAIAWIGSFLLFAVPTIGPAAAQVLGSNVYEILKYSGLIMFVIWLGVPISLFVLATNMRNEAPQLMRGIPFEPLKQEALGAVQRCFIRAFPPNAPVDLADAWRHGWYTNEGRPLASEIVDTDSTSLAAIEVANAWESCFQGIRLLALITLFPCVSLLFLTLLGAWFLGRVGTNPGVTRAQELDRRQAVEGAILISAGGIEWSRHQEQARVQQLAEAMRDKTPVMRLGVATGILAGRGDSYAPSSGIFFDLSLKDLQNHLLVLGGTGSGKTSGVLRPMAHQIANNKDVGLVVMDGKSLCRVNLKMLKGCRLLIRERAGFLLSRGFRRWNLSIRLSMCSPHIQKRSLLDE